MKKLTLTIFMLTPFLIFGQVNTGYQVPPREIADLVNAPQTPAVTVNARGDWMLLMERPGYISIEELAQPELRLAGLRINPRTNGPSRGSNFVNLKIKSVQGDQERQIQGLPAHPLIQNVSWSPDGQKIAFTLMKDQGLELWMADFNDGRAQQLTGPVINDALGSTPYQWFSDSKRIIFRSVLENRGDAPASSIVPSGPTIQETSGKKAPVRTYQDLLKNKHDEELFEYYASGQLEVINLETKSLTPFGEPGIYTQMSPSPDGKYVLTTVVNKPYSYLVPFSRFPLKATVVDDQGNLVRKIADIPLAESIPKGFGAVRTGPRAFMWRHDLPATLYWAEAQDEGDPAKEVEVRDQLFYMEAPFNKAKQPDISMNLRYGGVTWGDDNLAIVYEWWWTSRKQVTSSFLPGKAGSKQVIFDRSFEDRYNDPGTFQTTVNQFGKRVLLTNKRGTKLYLTGQGASPEGNQPFVHEFEVATGKTTGLWRSKAPYYEFPIRVLDVNKSIILTRRESKEEPPNFFLRDLKRNKISALTDIRDPYPQLKGIEKQVVKYKRNDGVDLKGDLYLPLGYKKEEGPLPVIMWAYPNEYKSADAAGQVEGSPYEFIRLGWWSPLYFLTRGYAVFDDPSMPVIGEGDEEPNDNFRTQLVNNAAAAIDKLVEMGIADKDKVAIGGHSYGAFMTANLLAHSDLFAAGIARSGAYNRTLTPFGFQAEERTYWEAPEVYYTMSPFMHADKSNEPMLMIHGEADNNSGTYPLQSKRMFAAMKGLGGKARLVMLPHESHGYRAKESILHMLWEMNQLLEKYVKNGGEKEMDTSINLEGGEK